MGPFRAKVSNALKQLSRNLSLLTLELWLCGCVAVQRFCQALRDTRKPGRIGSRAGFDGPGV